MTRCQFVAAERMTGMPDNRCLLEEGHDGQHEHSIPKIVARPLPDYPAEGHTVADAAYWEPRRR